MKMIIANIDDAISGDITKILIDANYRVTQLAATGGFLRGGATTLMIGVEDDFVQDVLGVLRDNILKHPSYEENIASLYVLKVRNSNRSLEYSAFV